MHKDFADLVAPLLKLSPLPGPGSGTGWHVIIRYHRGHERRIEGFASKAEAVDWISGYQVRTTLPGRMLDRIEGFATEGEAGRWTKKSPARGSMID